MNVTIGTGPACRDSTVVPETPQSSTVARRLLSYRTHSGTLAWLTGRPDLVGHAKRRFDRV